jgi:hypothetical protein
MSTKKETITLVQKNNLNKNKHTQIKTLKDLKKTEEGQKKSNIFCCTLKAACCLPIFCITGLTEFCNSLEKPESPLDYFVD